MRNQNLVLGGLVFLVGALSKFDVTIIARLPIGEILAFAATPVLLFRKGLLIRHLPKLVSAVIVLLLWCLAVAISDIVNGFRFEFFIRSFMRPIFCGLWMLFFVGIMLKDFRAIIFFPIGQIIAALQNLLAPRAFTIDRITQSEYGEISYGLVPVIISISLSLCLLLYQRSRLWSVIIFLLTAVVLFAVGAPRSAGAVNIINAGILFYIWWTRPESGRVYRLTAGRVLFFSATFVIASLVIFYAYVFVAGSGWLGEAQLAKLNDQRNTIFGLNPLGLLLDGRTYVFAAILGIIDHPLLGSGSWSGYFMSDYYYQAVSMVGTDSRELALIVQTGAGRAGHSVLFENWLENGILCAVATIIIGYWVFRQLLLVVQRDNRLAPLTVAWATSFAWSFLFSPLNVGTRILIGLFLAFHAMKFHEIRRQT